jgi:PEGA domain
LGALLVVSRPATAADPRDESRAAFLRGVSEAHQEHFTAARDDFLEAYRLFPHPSILLNLGIARMRTGEYVLAEENLSRYLTDDGGAAPEDLANARAALSVVRQHLGTLRLHVTPKTAQVSLDGVKLDLGSAAFADFRAVVGSGKLRVEADGYTAVSRDVLIAHDEVASVDVNLSLMSTAPPPAVPIGHPAASMSPQHEWLGWGLLGGAVVVAGVASGAGVAALGEAHDYNTQGNPGYQSPSVRNEGIAWRTSADVLFTTAIVAAGVGVYLLVRPHKPASDLKGALSPTVHGAVVQF